MPGPAVIWCAYAEQGSAHAGFFCTAEYHSATAGRSHDPGPRQDPIIVPAVASLAATVIALILVAGAGPAP